MCGFVWTKKVKATALTSRSVVSRLQVIILLLTALIVTLGSLGGAFSTKIEIRYPLQAFTNINNETTRRNKYLVYSTRYDGFNNQLDQVRLAICSAYTWKRTLVLMPMWHDWNWKMQNLNLYEQFGDFFDLGVLSELVPVIEYRDFLQYRIENSVPAVDIFCYEPAQKEQILNMTGFSSGSCAKNILGSSVETVAAFTDLGSMCSTYGVAHPYRRGHKVEDRSMHGLVAKHLTWSKQVMKYADNLIKRNVDRHAKFAAIHVRLGDYKSKHCGKLTHCPTPREIARCLQNIEIDAVFIATNPEDMEYLKSRLSRELGVTNISIFDSSMAESNAPGHLISTIEQAVCSRAQVFIGTNSSSWSQIVYDVRDASGYAASASLTWQQCSKAVFGE